MTSLARSLNLFRLTYSSSVDREAKVHTAQPQDSISTDSVELTLVSEDREKVLFNFEIHDKNTGSVLPFNFGLRFWPSYVDYHGH